MAILNPSPAITVPEHTSIGETIQILLEHKVGSVIITTQTEPHSPVGIFTERDLLKYALDFKGTNQWTVAIANVMTRHLITCPLDQLDQANALMLKHNIRHLPITHIDENGNPCLAGVVSMRSAFRALVEEKENLKTQIQESSSLPMISVIAKKQIDQQLQLGLLSQYGKLQFIHPDQSDPAWLESKLIILDIDHLSIHRWTTLLRQILDEPNHPPVFLLFSPNLHEKKTIDTLQLISKGKALQAYPKPVSLLNYCNEIQKVTGTKKPGS